MIQIDWMCTGTAFSNLRVPTLHIMFGTRAGIRAASLYDSGSTQNDAAPCGSGSAPLAGVFFIQLKINYFRFDKNISTVYFGYTQGVLYNRR
jgi:hypothetical protein